MIFDAFRSAICVGDILLKFYICFLLHNFRVRFRNLISLLFLNRDEVSV
jgi:hypothetical protein